MFAMLYLLVMPISNITPFFVTYKIQSEKEDTIFVPFPVDIIERASSFHETFICLDVFANDTSYMEVQFCLENNNLYQGMVSTGKNTIKIIQSFKLMQLYYKGCQNNDDTSKIYVVFHARPYDISGRLKFYECREDIILSNEGLEKTVKIHEIRRHNRYDDEYNDEGYYIAYYINGNNSFIKKSFIVDLVEQALIVPTQKVCVAVRTSFKIIVQFSTPNDAQIFFSSHPLHSGVWYLEESLLILIKNQTTRYKELNVHIQAVGMIETGEIRFFPCIPQFPNDTIHPKNFNYESENNSNDSNFRIKYPFENGEKSSTFEMKKLIDEAYLNPLNKSVCLLLDTDQPIHIELFVCGQPKPVYTSSALSRGNFHLEYSMIVKLKQDLDLQNCKNGRNDMIRILIHLEEDRSDHLELEYYICHIKNQSHEFKDDFHDYIPAIREKNVLKSIYFNLDRPRMSVKKFVNIKDIYDSGMVLKNIDFTPVLLTFNSVSLYIERCDGEFRQVVGYDAGKGIYNTKIDAFSVMKTSKNSMECNGIEGFYVIIENGKTTEYGTLIFKMDTVSPENITAYDIADSNKTVAFTIDPNKSVSRIIDIQDIVTDALNYRYNYVYFEMNSTSPVNISFSKCRFSERYIIYKNVLSETIELDRLILIKINETMGRNHCRIDYQLLDSEIYIHIETSDEEAIGFISFYGEKRKPFDGKMKQVYEVFEENVEKDFDQPYIHLKFNLNEKSKAIQLINLQELIKPALLEEYSEMFADIESTGDVEFILNSCLADSKLTFYADFRKTITFSKTELLLIAICNETAIEIENQNVQHPISGSITFYNENIIQKNMQKIGTFNASDIYDYNTTLILSTRDVEIRIMVKINEGSNPINMFVGFCEGNQMIQIYSANQSRFTYIIKQDILEYLSTQLNDTFNPSDLLIRITSKNASGSLFYDMKEAIAGKQFGNYKTGVFSQRRNMNNVYIIGHGSSQNIVDIYFNITFGYPKITVSNCIEEDLYKTLGKFPVGFHHLRINIDDLIKSTDCPKHLWMKNHFLLNVFDRCEIVFWKPEKPFYDTHLAIVFIISIVTVIASFLVLCSCLCKYRKPEY